MEDTKKLEAEQVEKERKIVLNWLEYEIDVIIKMWKETDSLDEADLDLLRCFWESWKFIRDCGE